MRLFLAIDLPKASKKLLEEKLFDLKKEYADFKWVREENYHITLTFFGEVEKEKKDKIIKAVELAVYDIESFHLYSQDAGLFLNEKVVLYINFRREKRLELIVDRIKSRLNLVEGKKFTSHSTIARTKIPSKQQYLHLKKKLQRLDVNLDFNVSRIYLFQSILEGKRPVYKKIVSFKLLMPHQS